MHGLSAYVKEQIVGGNSILFLGAGASVPAQGSQGMHGLTGNQLKESLCDEFLGGESKNRLLNYVADRSISVAGMGPVHRHLKKLFGNLSPTEGHLLIPEFRWKGIVSTNYDFLVEQAYDRTTSPQQQIERIIWDRDDFGIVTRNSNAVAYLKLHGCLNRINDPELPLVISSHDYYKFKTNRGQLINTFREWGTSCPIIFCGYSISDENIKEILFDLSDKYSNRPEYVLVDPSLEKGDIDYWKSNRFSCVTLSFSDFMQQLRNIISPDHVLLGRLQVSDQSVSKLIPSHSAPSQTLIRYLNEECRHIHSAFITPLIPPKEFYRGNSDGFAWISENYDVRRRVIDTLITDLVLESGRSNLSRPFFYILNGYAGSGKSVVLKRFAWEAATEYGAAVFYVGIGAVLRINELIELVRLISSRIIVVLDDALVHKIEIKTLISECKKHRLPITIVAGARNNEWNVTGGELDAEVEATYDLLDFNRGEVESLISKLDSNGCLGFLEHLTPDDRTTYFLNKLKSQLLVALHEATEGKSFEEIILDEYKRTSPPEARLLYLDVCTLDRFNVGVRAGPMSRISGVTFEQFSKRLLSPLEHVINVHFDHRAGDYLYRTRHQNIAEIVFDGMLVSQADRSAQIVRIVKYLNGAYESDSIALQQLVKGRLLAVQFSDRAYVAQIFDAGLESGLHPSIVDHQKAVFELHHPHGDIRSALSLLGRVEQNPGTLLPRTIAHTKANILRRLASIAKTDLEKERYRNDALSILNTATKSARDSLSFVTKGQLLLEQLRERMQQGDERSDEEIDVRIVAEMTKEIESTLRQGLDHFPEDERLLSFEAELSKFLDNTPRALRALERAYAKNRQSVFTTIRLARQYAKTPESKNRALEMLRKLTSEQPLSKEAHLALANILIRLCESDNQAEIGQHLKRSFAAGDSHFEARFLYARHEFLYGSYENANREFASLRNIPIKPETIHRVRAEICDKSGNPVIYDGIVKRKHESFAFVRCVSFHDDIFMHFKVMPNADEWESLLEGARLRFTMGFTYKGPTVKCVNLVKL